MKILKRAFAISICLFIITALKVGGVETTQEEQEARQDFKPLVIVSEQIKPTPTPTPEPQITDLGTYTITGYCACEKCCGKWAKNRSDGVVFGAEGTALVSEISVANNNFDFGTRLFIDGWGEVVVQDRTAKWVNEKYNGKILDIYFDSHEQAVKFAKREMKVGIVE